MFHEICVYMYVEGCIGRNVKNYYTKRSCNGKLSS